jgi:hypothetical protein
MNTAFRDSLSGLLKVREEGKEVKNKGKLLSGLRHKFFLVNPKLRLYYSLVVEVEAHNLFKLSR